MMRRVTGEGLNQRTLSYDCLGATRPGDDGFDAPAGYRRYERSVRIGYGDDDFRRAADALLRWEVKTRSGFTVLSGAPVEGERLWITFRAGPVMIAEPAVVVAVVQEEDRAGFAYGTLVGHPIAGEEAFLVRRDADGTVWFTLRSLSRRAPGAWGSAYPFVLLVQRVFRRRYLRALS